MMYMGLESYGKCMRKVILQLYEDLEANRNKKRK